MNPLGVYLFFILYEKLIQLSIIIQKLLEPLFLKNNTEIPTKICWNKSILFVPILGFIYLDHTKVIM